MTAVHRGFPHETDVLIRRVDAQLARLRAQRQAHDLELAERLVDSLRQLILATAQASAHDRARVRAAVHYFVLRSAGRRSIRPLVADLLVVNDVARRVGRPDLVVGPAGGSGLAAPSAARSAAELSAHTPRPLPAGADNQRPTHSQASGGSDKLAG